MICLSGVFPGLTLSSTDPDPALLLRSSPDGILLRIKVVSGARHSAVSGSLGDCLKITVAAPPEGGLANQEVYDLLAKVFGVSRRDVKISVGVKQPRKSIELLGLNFGSARDRLQAVLGS